MADVTCVDGSTLSVLPVPVLDRHGSAYEVTLSLTRDGAPFGDVGERCGWFLTRTAAALRDAGGFPERPEGARDHELFCFRSRDPDDLGTVGELRAVVHDEHAWTAHGWEHRSRAVLSAWGAAGIGVQAVLTSEGLLAFLDALAADVERVAG